MIARLLSRTISHPSSLQADDLSKTMSCDGCDAMFARKHDLDRKDPFNHTHAVLLLMWGDFLCESSAGHRRIHTLEAPYMCRGCRRSYRRSDARKRHWDQDPACNVLHVRNANHPSSPTY